MKSNSLQAKQQAQRFFSPESASFFSNSEKSQRKRRPEIPGNENIAKKLAVAALLSMDALL
ncbi:hypothetical protein [Legionella nautarum]|uniref:hypothetical protein n=1 Tax=Legionella nautarum TaxID=45070 RepID=UPI001054C9C2|nr:hypothetical protein [Legionella nautarum]